MTTRAGFTALCVGMLVCVGCAGTQPPAEHPAPVASHTEEPITLSPGPTADELVAEIHFRLGTLLCDLHPDHPTEGAAHLEASAEAGFHPAVMWYLSGQARVRAGDLEGARRPLQAALASCTAAGDECDVEGPIQVLTDLADGTTTPAETQVPAVYFDVTISRWEEPVESLGLTDQQAHALHDLYRARREYDRAADHYHSVYDEAEGEAARELASSAAREAGARCAALVELIPGPPTSARQAVLFAPLIATCGPTDEDDQTTVRHETLRRALGVARAGRALGGSAQEQLRLAYLEGAYLAEVGEFEAAVAAFADALAQAEARQLVSE